MSNSSKTLKQIVSVDGWIGIFDENGEASVHADVVFREGHFGNDAASTVRFKVHIHRAEIVLCIPGDGPLRIRRSSIMRNPSGAGRERRIETETTLEGEAAASAALSITAMPTAKTSLGVQAKAAHKVTEARTEQITDFLEQHFTSPDKNPAWEVQSADRKAMNGSPWNASASPRLSVKRTTSDEQPHARIEIRCRREDLRIEGLELKDPLKQRRFSKRPDPDKNRAAAEQVIKEELARAGFFELPDMTEDYSNVLIADVVITEDFS